MDIQAIFNAGGTVIKNPNYKKGKKNIEPEYITVSDLDSGIKPDGSLVADIAYDAAARGRQSILGRNGELDTYIEHGLTPNSWENLDKLMIEQQGGLTKFGNAFAQAIISEALIGTAVGVSDMFDMIGQSVGLSDPNYQNPVTNYLIQKQEEFKEATKIWADPDKNIFNGGLIDAGWWASNIPSIASSLTLLLPSTGVVKGLSYLAKARNVSRFTRNAVRVLSGAERRLKYARELRAAGATAEEIQAASKLTKMQRVLNSSSTINATNLFLENGTTAALSRAMENYQEARQTYNDMYVNASETLKKLKDSNNPEDKKKYNDIIRRSENILKDDKGNYKIDINNPDEVAKIIAKESADKTFKLDWINVGWDILQMYGLRNAWKGLKNAPDTPASVRRTNLDAAKYFGKSKEEISKLKAQRTLKEKFGEKLSDFMYGSKLAINAELSEGAEEALNYIAQQEGMNFGKVLLGQEQKSNFDTRLYKYIQTPEMYDAAFWGVMGGVVFQGLGSQFRRLSNKLTEDKRANDESKKALPWYKLDELPEIKRSKTAIEANGIDFETYAIHQKKIIEDNVDIYHPNIDSTERKFETEFEKQAAIRKLKNEYITKMTLRAMNSGTLDMFKEFMANDNVRKGMVARGIFGKVSETKSEQDIEAESKDYIKDALNQINKIEEQYDEELIALDSAAAAINSGKLTDSDEYDNNNKKYKSTAFDTIPIEYLQIMAVNNVTTRLEIDNLRTEEAATEQRITDLLNIPGIQENLDENVDYRNSLKIAIITRELGQLRAERSRLMADESKDLSNTLSIEAIDKNIAALEKQLDDIELVYATGIALQFVSDGDGKYHQEATAESVAYQDAMITKSIGKELGEVLNIPGLEYLSNRSKTTLGDEKIAQEKIVDQNIQLAINTLRNVSPELLSSYQEIAAIQTRLDFANNDIVRTVDQVKHQAGILNNTMNEARKSAINGANKILLDMYRKYGNKVLDAIYDKYNINGSDSKFNKTTADMTKEEKQNLSDAIDVLDLTNDSNKALLDVILERFELEDAIRAAKEEETNDEESQSSVIIGNSISDTEMSETDNSSSDIIEVVNGQKIEQIDNVNAPIDPQKTENRTPNYYTKFYTDKKGKLIGKTNDKTDKNSSSIAVYDNEDGTFTLDVRGNKQNLNDTRFFSNTNEVDLTRPFEIERKPIAVRNEKDKLVISKPGRLVNTDTLEYQQAQEEKAQQKQIQQENDQEVQNEDTPVTQNTPSPTPSPTPAITESTPASETPIVDDTPTPAPTASKEDSTSSAQPITSSTGEQEQNSNINIFSNISTISEMSDKKLKDNSFIGKTNQIIAANWDAYKDEYDEYKRTGDKSKLSSNKKVKPEDTIKFFEDYYSHLEKLRNAKQDSTKTTKSVEDVINQVPAGDEINNEALSKFIIAAKANHDVDLDAMANKLINEYVAKGSDRAIVESAVTKAKNIIQRKLDRLKANNNETTMRSSIDEVLIAQSTITEVISDTDAVKAYKEAVKNMIAQYAKEVGLEELDGKFYINLEDLLRYTNTSTNDRTTSAALFESMKQWLSTFEAKEKYIVTDEAETNKQNFIENTKKTAEERYLERLADVSVQRVDIQSYVKTLTNPNDVNTFYDALDALQPGMSLNTKVVGSIVHILDGQNRVVGTMPIPSINSSTGAYEMYNDGWKTDVDIQDGSIVSSLKDLFTELLTSKDDNIKQLNSIIFQLAYTNPDDETKETLYAKLENNSAWKSAKNKGFMADNASTKKLANGLVKLWKFAKPSSNAPIAIQNIQIKESINAWFEKLKHSYDAVSALSKGGNLNISVATISDGELVRIGKTKAEAEAKALPVKEAIAGGVNPTIHKIAVVDSIIDGKLNVAGAPNLNLSGVGKGNTFVILPNRSGRPGYAHAYPAKVIDDYIGEDAKDIVKTIHDIITKLLNEHNNNPNKETFNNIKNFFISLLDNKNGNKSLFNGLTVSVTTTRTNNEVLNIGIPNTANQIKIFSNSNSIFIGKDDFTEKEITVNGQKVKTKTQKFNLNTSDTYKNIFDILNNLSFKLSYAYIAGDNVSDQPMYGFANRINGKFEINIGEKSWSYNSFNEFILNNNLVRLNTKPASDGRSNYERRGHRSQVANQVFEIKITKATTSPVEKKEKKVTPPPVKPSTPALSIPDKAMNILTSVTPTTNKGLSIAELYFDKNTLNILESLNILPKNIIFDSEFNNKPGYEHYNAEVNPRTGKVIVGQKWVDMFNDPRTTPEAIRKLIHEQLHHRLYKNNGYVRSAKAIYNEFKIALDNEGVPANDNIRAYLFENLPEDEALEEFLVETLTSQELANKLNSIDAQGYDKKSSRNLLQKVLKLMSKIFGWGVRKGSLYEKELYTLRQNFKENKENKTIIEEESKIEDNINQDNKDIDDTNNNQDETNTTTQAPVAPPTIVPPITPTQPSQFGTYTRRGTRGKFKSGITEISDNDSNYSNEMQTIKEQAISNRTFMKALNGNPTNLTEKQWLQVRTKAFKEWFGDWENPFTQINKPKIIFGHPAIGKTYAIEGKYKDKFIDWDVEYNKKRDKWIEEHSGTKKGTNEYKKARNEYLIHPERHSDYIEFLTNEWNRVKNKADKENKILLASPHTLLKLFPNDFDYIINVEKSNFISRNVNRGGKEYESSLWKEGIDETIANTNNIPIYNLQKGKYLSDLLDEANNVSKVVDENGEPLVVYHGTQSLKEFSEFNKDIAIYTTDDLLTAISYIPDKLHEYTEKLTEGSSTKEILDVLQYYTSQLKESEPFDYFDSNYTILKRTLEPLGITVEEKNTYTIEDLEKYKNLVKATNIPIKLARGVDAFVKTLFGKIKNPIIIDAKGDMWNKILFNGKIYSTRELEQLYKNTEYDGIIIKNILDYAGAGSSPSTIYIQYKPNQIKSAIDNIGTFSTTDNNIRHSSITEHTTKVASVSSFTDRLPISQQAKFATMIRQGDIKTSCR